jgi:hypothetical protein
MAIKGPNEQQENDDQFEKRNLRFKNAYYFKDDNEFTVVSVRMGKLRKEALAEYLRLTTGKDISTFVRELIYEYMDENSIRPFEKEE